jgi:putative flippase GtrA
VTVVDRLLQSRFLRFALVGGAGFLVNSATLYAVIYLVHVDKYGGWFPAFLVAVTFTWWGNRTLTFRDVASSKGLFREWAIFLVANSFGALANFAAYSALVKFAPHPLSYPLAANGVGTLVGMVLNFVASKHFVFRDQSAKPR